MCKVHYFYEANSSFHIVWRMGNTDTDISFDINADINKFGYAFIKK